jgi:protein-L-isoaspartate(D-aspartate) O-methyltransferase
MTDLADLADTSRVLEVGTGSGYQAAVLAEMAAEVDTVEIDPFLAGMAADRLAALGYHNAHVWLGNGSDGWAERAPYDAIVATAAAPSIPRPLVDQLVPGGRIVIPVGPPSGRQTLRLLKKDRYGTLLSVDVLPVVFVPLTATH